MSFAADSMSVQSISFVPLMVWPSSRCLSASFSIRLLATNAGGRFFWRLFRSESSETPLLLPLCENLPDELQGAVQVAFQVLPGVVFLQVVMVQGRQCGGDITPQAS